jgi:thiol-disulfide isomerase/thioredoxin
LLAGKADAADRPLFDAEEFRAQPVGAKQLDPDYVKYIRTTDPSATRKEAEKLFERAIRDYGDVAYDRANGIGDRTVADAARPALFELQNLAVGKTAPEIEGEDIDGKPMKLSDYRGKVVVLSFWASWCGPCMGLVPDERALVDRLNGKPFVLLGINGDTDRAKAKEVVEKERITWRSWWNGGRTGTITDPWNIESWPTLYILDANGVIRYKHVRLELSRLVDTLLKEMDAKGGKP